MQMLGLHGQMYKEVIRLSIESFRQERIQHEKLSSYLELAAAEFEWPRTINV